MYIHYGDAELINQLFAAGENLYTVGNDYGAELNIIASNAHANILGTITKTVTNSVTEKMWSSYSVPDDSRQCVKFVSGTEVWYTEKLDGDSVTYHAIGCLKGSKGNKWIHSQWYHAYIYMDMQSVVYYLIGK